MDGIKNIQVGNDFQHLKDYTLQSEAKLKEIKSRTDVKEDKNDDIGIRTTDGKLYTLSADHLDVKWKLGLPAIGEKIRIEQDGQVLQGTIEFVDTEMDLVTDVKKSLEVGPKLEEKPAPPIKDLDEYPVHSNRPLQSSEVLKITVPKSIHDLEQTLVQTVLGKVETSEEKSVSVGVTSGPGGVGLQGGYTLNTDVEEYSHISLGDDFYSHPYSVARFTSYGVVGRIQTGEIAAGLQYKHGWELNRSQGLDPAIAFAATGSVGVNYGTGAFVELGVGPELSMQVTDKVTAYVLPEVVGRVGGNEGIDGRLSAGVRFPLR